MRKFQHILKVFILILVLIFKLSDAFSQIDTIPNLVLWLSADSGIISDNGSHIKEWADHSTNHIICVQNDSNARPVQQYSFLNNKPSVLFDGSNDFISGNININKANISVFILLRIFNYIQYSGIMSLINSTQANDWQNSNSIVCLDINPPYLTSERSGSSLKYSDNWQNKPLLLSATYTSGRLKSFLNSEPADSVFNNFSDFDINKIILGSRYNSYNASYFTNAELAEIVVFDTILSNNLRNEVETCLMNKYAPPVCLPNDTALVSFCPFILKPFGNYTAYQWSDGSTNDSLIVNNSGNYKITATDIFGRQSVDSIFIQFPTSFQSQYNLCYNDSFYLNTNLESSSNTFIWQDNSTLPNFLVNIPGQYYVHITDSLGCTYFSDTISVYYDNFSFENVLADSSKICIGDSLSVFNPQAVLYDWSTGENTPFILPQNTDWYYVTLTNTNGCKLKDSSYVFIKGQKPQPQIQLMNACSEQSALYHGLSTGNISQWQWVVKDTANFEGQNISIIYSNAGIYHSILHVIDSNTCEGYAFSTDTIHDSPYAAFSFNSGCNGQNAVFSSQSVCEDSISSYLWIINNQEYLGQTIQKDLSPDTYFITHHITTSYGCSDSVIQKVIISNLPLVKADANFPIQGMSLLDSSIVFSWNNHGEKSLIEISTTSDFSQIISQGTKSIANQYLSTFLPFDTIIYWRIWTFSDCEDSIVSNSYWFSRKALTSFSNLSLWLSSDSGVILDNGNQIKQWIDKSSNHYVFYQNDSLARPLSQGSFLNYKPSVVFDGVNDFLTSNIHIYNENISAFVVNKINNYIQYSGIISLYDSTQSNDWQPENSAVLFFANPPFISSERAENIINYTNDFLSVPLQLTSEFSSEFIKTYKNSNYIDSLFINQNAINVNKIIIGSRYNDFVASFFTNTEIAELVIFDTIFPLQQKHLIETYLMDKYAPPVLLPADTILTSFCPFAIIPRGYFISCQWSTGDTNDTLIVQHSGKYILRATDIFGRISKDSIIVTFPTTNIPDTVFVCNGDSTLLTSSLGNLVDYQWSNGSIKNYSYLKNEGWYYITITDLQSCSNIDSFYVKVDSLSTWSLFSNDSTNFCSGNLLTIESIPYNISSYIWQPTNDHTNNTVVSQTGWYSVEVQDINQCRQKDSVFVTIMGLAPIANFSFSHTCKGQETFFTDQSVSLDTSPVSSWQWIIQNDTIITQHPVYQFSDYGNYTIKLVVGTSSGCYQTNEQDISIFPLPNPSFSAVRLCSGHETYFDSHTSIPVGNVIGLTWIWGDGTSSFDSDTTHVYSQPGSYLVTLIAESDQNCVDSISQNIEIKPSPIAGFDVSPSCNLNPTFFVDTSKTDYFNPIMQWTWSFGDGGTSHTQHPNHIYQQTGIYTVELITKSLNGCMDTTQQSITVSSKPNADFNVDNACVGQSILLQDHSTITNGQITEWNWYVHNDYFSSLQNPTYIPSELNNLPFTLIVKSNTRCTDTISKSITVYPKPFVNFDLNPTYGALPLTVQFINHSEFGSSNWNFGDGSFSSQANPIHVFQDSGLYRVWLTQTSIHGCIDSVSKTVLVVPNLLDLAIESVNYTKLASFIFIHTLISNVGTLPIENPVLSLIVDGQTFVSEIVYDTLFSGEKRYYTFNGIIPTASGMPNYLCVNGSILSTQQEVNLYNNENCLSFSEEEQILNLYPNPANDQLYMLLQLNEEQNVLFSIIDITGKTVYQDQRYLQNVLHKINIDITSLSQGMYALQVKTKKHTFVHKFIKE